MLETQKVDNNNKILDALFINLRPLDCNRHALLRKYSVSTGVS